MLDGGSSTTLLCRLVAYLVFVLSISFLPSLSANSENGIDDLNASSESTQQHAPKSDKAKDGTPLEEDIGRRNIGIAEQQNPCLVLIEQSQLCSRYPSLQKPREPFAKLDSCTKLCEPILTLGCKPSPAYCEFSK